MPAGSEVKVGVVGLGYFGSHHARHYAAHPEARLVAVVDSDPERSGPAARRFGAAALDDHRALIGQVEAASVAVPTSLHHRVAGDLIDAGIHVFVEKPIAIDAREAADLVERARGAGVILQVGHIERYAPAFRALLDRVEAPRLIECVRHTTWTGRATDVDVVLDLMIHDIDLALTVAGSTVVSAEASGARIATDSNDVAEARLVFANGVVATLAASRVAAVAERSVSVSEIGRNLAADLSGQTLSIVTGVDGTASSETMTLAAADNLGSEISAFLESVRNGAPPPVDGMAGLDAMKVADMILAAISRGQISSPDLTNGVPA
ncbi:MAG: Gfo/Idh/MocA family oxidoreductase [Bauldia sp.]|uniref:Gfo/Idh/MocA family protein n=1 Tax=Bauldia sp. TaxID=2575872 RepID=UPI001D7D47BF|nr:Gfo/Idh/MocA family oxidoreductase [Bauldia sp.]MCB1497280.1 Gfo/Idh/MocA family oxidoreductase [Bauldia sp.]